MRRAAVTAIVSAALVIAASIPAAARQHEHSQHGQPKQPVPPVTDADRKAAFPPGMEGHAVHDRKFNYFILFDQVEWLGSSDGGIKVDKVSWFGGDINRGWLRFDGETHDGAVESASADALYGHSFSRWWDVVAGIRQDFRPGDPQTWAAIGVQGLAPQWFEVELTGYVGASGRTAARLEVEYEWLFTNRVILQPLIELEIYGKDDPERGLGAGLSSIETGLRLRYEIRRELAPYIGITWDRKLFGTADLARQAGEDAGRTRVAFGLRTWF
jgi:copper resistance protein B